MTFSRNIFLVAPEDTQASVLPGGSEGTFLLRKKKCIFFLKLI